MNDEALIGIYMSRLSKCSMWTEQSRVEGNVNLMGATENGKVRLETCSEKVLTEMLRRGLVGCEAQQRLIASERYLNSTTVSEVTVKYWRVL